MEREIIFNYTVLNDYLNEQQKNPQRTDGELTMLRDNCKNYIKKEWKNSDNFVIKINDETLDISINWQSWLENIFKTLPTWYRMSNKVRLYSQVISAIQEAKDRGIYEQIFETKKKLNNLKDSIENPN